MDMQRRRDLQDKSQQEEAAVQGALEDMERRPQAMASPSATKQDLSVAAEEPGTESGVANAGLLDGRDGPVETAETRPQGSEVNPFWRSESVLESQGGGRDNRRSCLEEEEKRLREELEAEEVNKTRTPVIEGQELLKMSLPSKLSI